MRNKLKIAISGKSGCGNSSVSRIIAEKLNYRLINYTFHNMADERNIEFEKFCRMVEKDTKYDIELDKKLLELAKEPGCVLGSRLAIWLLKDADLTVYLYASPDVRAKRIAMREKISFDDSYRDMMSRDERDRARYIKLYNIDINDYKKADLIINTENIDQDAVADMIIKKAKTILK
jgi:CMP/dCMP kinase